jgi:hypothetical protein
MAKEIDEFVFDGTPINETLVRDLSQRKGGGQSWTPIPNLRGSTFRADPQPGPGSWGGWLQGLTRRLESLIFFETWLAKTISRPTFSGT